MRKPFSKAPKTRCYPLRDGEAARHEAAERRTRARRRIRALAVVGVAAVVVAGFGGGVAWGLWRDADTVAPAPFGVGGVSFAATASSTSAGGSAGTPDVSTGGAVTVSLPGSVVAEALNNPVVWQFTVSGAADGIAGLDYTVSYPDPTPPKPGYFATVLQASTFLVYPAGPGGDCSNHPAHEPTPDANGNITLAGDGSGPASHYLLQAAGQYNNQGFAPETTRTWCASVTFNSAPDGEHVNIATVTATASNGDTASSYSEFDSAIQYPNVLSPVGIHSNIASVEGQASNGAWARDQSQWVSTLFPDPSKEPSVPITITPVVTNVNSGYTPTGGP